LDRDPALVALVPGLLVAVGITVGVIVESYVPQQIGYLGGGLGAIALYVRATRREDGERVKWLMLVNLGLILMLGVVNVGYEISNQKIGATHSVKAGIDEDVPVLPVFVFPYLGLYVYTVFTFAYLGVLADHARLRTMLLGLIGSTLVGLLTFVTFQTYVPPPSPSDYGPEPLRAMMVYVEEALYDGNYYSAFPSLHVAYSTVLALAWARIGRRLLSPALIVLSALVALSTQFLHQHYVLDLYYGIVLGVAAHATAWWATEWRPSHRPA